MNPIRALLRSILAVAIAALLVVACGDDAPRGSGGDTADAAQNDTGVSTDGADSDTNGAQDTGAGQDTSAVDTESDVTTDTTTSDTGADTTTADTTGSDSAAEDTAEPDVNPAAPTCTITAPTDGTVKPFDEAFTFVAQATDPEDGDLTGASVIWRSDRVTNPLGSGLSVTTTLAPGGSHVITCTAVDSDGNTGQDSMTVVAQSPYAEIWHPGDGETRPAANAVPFTGRGTDLEDGDLTGAALVWTTTVAGTTTEIGQGQNFNAQLPAGANVVTLTATDGDGNVGTASITLTITP